MANVQEEVEKIARARYGKDVRGSICSAILAMNEESSEAIDKAVTAQDSATVSAAAALSSQNAAKDSEDKAAEYAEEAKRATTGIYHFKGSVNTRAELPSNPSEGDVYDIISEGGMNVAWTGSKWDELGSTVDLSLYQKKLIAGENITIDPVTNIISATGGGAKAVIEVTAESEELCGKTVTLTGAQTATATFSSEGKCSFEVSKLGTYTVSASDGLETYSAEVIVSTIALYQVSIGESFGYKNWIKSVGKDASAYASLDDVLADEKLVRELMTRHASVDYLVEWLTKEADAQATFLANDNALKWIGLRDYAYDNMSQDFITSWLEGEKWEYALKDKVPIMTSDTAPYGEAFCSNAPLDSRFKIYYPFSKIPSEQYVSKNVGSYNTEVKLGYKFTNPTCIKRITFDSDVHSGHFRFLASNDGINWTELSTEMSYGADTNINNDNYYLYYAIGGKAISLNDGRYLVSYSTVQFYGRSLNVSSNDVGTLPPQTEPKVTIGGVTYWTNKSEREFAESSTMKYLYDHGVDVETVTKTTTSVLANIDTTDYKLLRATVGQYARTNDTIKCGSGSATLTTAMMPNNCYLDVSSINGTNQTGFSSVANTSDISCWLE